MDPISRYCAEAGIRKRELAKAIRRSPQLFTDFKAGRTRLSDETKLDLVRQSGGKITLEELTTWEPDDSKATA